MKASTRELWARQDRHGGDRRRLFGAIGAQVEATTVLYPGSWCDVAPSFVWADVTYVDADRNAARFFADDAGVAELVRSERGDDEARFRFVGGDYRDPLPVDDESVDLLISLYAGFVSDACTRYLRVGGTLLVNPSHGDAALASIDDRYELLGAVTARDGNYRIRTEDLEAELVPKQPIDLTRAAILERGKGVAYTRPAFAYLFRRIA